MIETKSHYLQKYQLGRISAQLFLKIIYRVTYAFLVLPFLVGCQSSRDNSNVAKLVYWSSNNQDEINLAKEVVAEWNQLHPDMPIKHQPVPEGESSEEVILAAVVGKTTPDIYSNMWPGDVASYVRADQLVAFDQFADFDSVAAERFSEEILVQSRSRDSSIYQILWKTNPIMLLYNQNMFRSVGFNGPTRTYEDYQEAAERLKQDKNGDGYVDQWVGVTDIRARWRDRLFDFYPLYIAATGGRTIIENGEITFDNEKAVGVFKFFQTMYANEYFPKEINTVRRDFFMIELAGSRIVGPWEIVHLEKFKPEGFEYDFTHVPVPDGVEDPVYTYGDMKSIVVFKNTKFPRESWEFVKFMINRGNDYKLLKIATQLPLRKDILEDKLFESYFEENPMMIKFAEQAKYLRGVDESPTLKEVFDAISQEFEACIVYGAKSPEQAVQDAATRARLVLE